MRRILFYSFFIFFLLIHFVSADEDEVFINNKKIKDLPPFESKEITEQQDTYRLNLLRVGWIKTNISYRIKIKGNVSQERVADVISSINYWKISINNQGGNYTKFDFVQKNNSADITITMISKNNSRGIRGTASIFVNRNREIRFCNIQIFGKGLTSDIEAFIVGAHEFGHCLGLGHANENANDLMCSSFASGGKCSIPRNITSCDLDGFKTIYPNGSFAGKKKVPSSIVCNF